MFDITHEENINLLAKVSTVFAYDVIAHEGLLTLTGEDGIFQYQYNYNENSLTEISKIAVNREAQ